MTDSDFGDSALGSMKASFQTTFRHLHTDNNTILLSADLRTHIFDRTARGHRPRGLLILRRLKTFLRCRRCSWRRCIRMQVILQDMHGYILHILYIIDFKMSDTLFKCQKSAFQYIIHKDVGSIDFSLITMHQATDNERSLVARHQLSPSCKT